MKIIDYSKKIYKFLKKDGLKGVAHRLDNIQEYGLIDVFEFYNFIMDETKIPLDEDAYKNKGEQITLNWIIPEMGAGSGGHINIFRFISNLEKMGMHSRVYIHRPHNFKDNDTLREFIKTHFSILDTRVEVYYDVKYCEFAHATFATSWHTAYFVKNFENTISKFYFVQDFEPYFSALGSEYQFAENTYKFGLRGITAGDWLKEKCHNEYGMETSSFGFSYDKDLYKPVEKKDNVKRVFFYARPVTPRRDFELGMLALKDLTDRMPDVEVVFAGWDVSNYYIPFKHQNLGVVKLEDLSELYSQCDMCLIISNTNLSLLPLEVMASNSVAVCSKGENSTWLVNENNSVLVDYDPKKIADTLIYYFEHPEELAVIRKNGLEFANNTSWEVEAEKVYNAIVEGIKKDEK